MSGKTIESEKINEIADFSFFYGNELEIVNCLKESLAYIISKKATYIHLSSFTKSQDLKELFKWIEEQDCCIQCYKKSDFPENFLSFLAKDKDIENIIPVRNVFFSKLPVGFIITEDIEQNDITMLQILAVITGQKLEMAALMNKSGKFMQSYLLGKLFPQISHEIKNKLIAPITFFKQLPEKKDNPSFINKFGNLAHEEIIRIKNQLDSILNFSKNDSDSSSTNLTIPLNYCLSLLDSQFTRYSITIETSLSNEIIFPIDEQSMRDILFNIILNSIHALKDVDRNKIIRIRTFNRTKEFGFIIEDNGCGMNKTQKDNIFSPFYTTKTKGTGLGLSIVKNYLDKSGASINLKTALNLGTFFEIIFFKENEL